jgi:putative two-component system response regulator
VTPATSARILVVDDDSMMRGLLERILEPTYSCAVAASAAEARARIAREDFALLLCDVNLPGESGLALARHALAEHPDTAVVIVTGVDDPVTARTAIDFGAYGYLIKPFRATEVTIAAANALRRRALERETRGQHERLDGLVHDRTEALHDALWRLEGSARELRGSRAETIQRLARAVELRDIDTGGHIERMSAFCELIARQCDVHPETMRVASPLHDVGKIAVPDRVLLKPGELTPEERVEMERHAEIGHEILTGTGSDVLELAAEIAWTHHERFGGGGYPVGLSGEEIPLEGRIAAVADVYDALTSDRVYRPAFSGGIAVKMMREATGSHFDPLVLEVFLGSLDEVEAIRRDHVVGGGEEP